MTKLDGIPAADLREALSETTDHKAVRRLMVALAYKDGDSVDRLSDLYGIPTSTVYYWLERFETRGLDGLEDESRPGRPPKLDEDDRKSLTADLATPPANLGYEAEKWGPELAKDHIRREYGIEYSLGHVRRLLREGQ